MLYRYAFFLLVFVNATSSKAINFDLLKTNRYTIDDGLPQSFVEQVHQDQKGFLWIATQDGVTRFDGYDFENFFSNPFDSSSILSNYIIEINDWGKDSLCFTSALGISIFDPVAKTFNNYPIGLNNKSIGKITSSSIITKDSLVLSCTNGLYGIKLTNQEAIVTPLKFAHSVTKSFLFKDQLFLVSDSSIYRLNDKNSYETILQFDQPILNVFRDEISVHIAFPEKLIQYDERLQKTSTFSIAEGINDCALISGNLWVATKNNGVLIYDLYEKNPIPWNLGDQKKHNLLSTNIRCIFEDCFGVIWLGTDKGINKIDPSKNQFLKFKPSLYSSQSRNNCWSFFENDSILFSGYDNGIQIHYKGTKKYEWVNVEGPVLDITEFEKKILIGTGKGVFALNYKDSCFALDSTKIDVSVKEKQDIIFKFFSFEGKLLIGSLNFLSVYNDSLELENRWQIKNVRDFTVFNNQVFFTAYPTGLYALSKLTTPTQSTFTRIPLPEVEHLLGLSIAASEHHVWIGLYGGGLIQFDPSTSTTRHYSTKDGLPNNTIYGIVPHMNTLWLSTNGGLSRLDLGKETFENFNTEDGIQSLEFNSGAKYVNQEGQIYMGGINGYNIINPKKENKNKIAPKVYISSIYYKGKDILTKESKYLTNINGDDEVSIPHFRNNFVIKVDGLHYSSPTENLFKTQLEGWQQNWSYSKGKRTFKFSNLNYGDYVFRVNVANSDGVWNYSEQKIKITIKPPFYLTWWFIALMILVVGGLSLYLVYSRINRSKFQREILEEKVRIRTREVEKQKRKLEDQNKVLEEEKNKEEEVLLNVLPRETARELVSTGKSTPRSYKMATVMFADFKNFTKITENYGPKELVSELDDSFAQFDDIVGKLNIEKIKTSGDAYMCVGGIPIRNKTNPVDCVLAAFQFQKYMRQKRDVREGTGRPQWHLRIGLHTGGLIAGVVGKKKFLYDVWGDTVNTAARMETSAEEGRINISGATYEFIKPYFDCEYRGKLPVKNKGAIDMYYVNRIKSDLCKDEIGETPNRKFFELLNFNVYTQQNFINVKDYFIDKLEKDEFVSKLKYHGPHHTLDVMEAAERIGRAEGLSEEDLMLVKAAALFHDSGFLNKYQDNESEGAKLAKRELPRYGFTETQVQRIEGMILATRIPQNPQNHLEEVLCDADLDYLGREKEEFDRISNSLAQELIDMKIIHSMSAWDPIQVKFLEMHHYYTKTCITLRRPGKIERLREIRDRLQGPNEE